MSDVFQLDRVYQRPFLKWLGGKTDSLDYIFNEVPDNARRFIEPFMGSGIVGLNAEPKNKIMSDMNRDLVELYRHVVESPSRFVDIVKSLFADGNKQEIYYQRRDDFNKTPIGYIERSALFVYLNRHCFNGVCRYNSSGDFNVPFGKYATVGLPTKEILNFSNSMKDAAFLWADFRDVFDIALPGDVFYCDPPYVPVVESGFVNYSGDGFSTKDQQDLADCARKACKKGATVLISNHWVNGIEDLYAGATLRQFHVQRSVASKGAGRVKTAEVLAVFRP